MRSDQVRQQRRLDPDRYVPEAVAAVYEDLLRTAREHLENGESVILDATWVSAEQRARAARVAQETGVELLAIRCTCDDAVGAHRIGERLVSGDDASEATVAVRDAMELRMDPWPSAAVIDTSQVAVSASLESALRKLSLEQVGPRS